MAHRNWLSEFQRLFVVYCVYQGVLWTTSYRCQDFELRDDEDYISGIARSVRSSSGSCGFGWATFGNKCYIVLGKHPLHRKNWWDANKNCRELDSRLASIHSKEEQDFLTSQIYRTTQDHMWIGLHRWNLSSTFEWQDGSQLDFKNWDVGEPNTNRIYEACVQMIYTRRGKWNDVVCTLQAAYICQSLKDSSYSFSDGSSGDGKGTSDKFLDQSSGEGEEDLCRDEICQNGGSCVDDMAVGNFQCVCATGYKGERCEQKALCTSDTCQNGGSCVEDPEVGGFRCICVNGSKGERCEERFPRFDISTYIYVIGTVIAVISLIIIIGVIIWFKRRSRRKNVENANEVPGKPGEDQSVLMSSCKRTQSQD